MTSNGSERLKALAPIIPAAEAFERQYGGRFEDLGYRLCAEAASSGSLRVRILAIEPSSDIPSVGVKAQIERVLPPTFPWGCKDVPVVVQYGTVTELSDRL